MPDSINKFPLWSLIACLLLSTSAESYSQGGITKKKYFYDKAQKEIEYSIFVPSIYNGKTKVPLIVALHGLGSNPHQIIRYSGLVKEAEKRGYIVVAPYGYNERGWYGSRGKGKEGFLFGEQNDPDNLGELSEGDVFNVLKIVREDYQIDSNRIYLMGHSMGGGIHHGIFLSPLPPPSQLKKRKKRVSASSTWAPTHLNGPTWVGGGETAADPCEWRGRRPRHIQMGEC